MSVSIVISCQILLRVFLFFFFKQKTAYEMRISDWSSDVCSSDLTRTFSIIKPDATRRNITGAVTKMLEDAGLRIVASKRIHMSREQKSEERRVGKECVSKCRSRRSPYH